jgi:tripeptidyl-peptidase I
VSPIYFAEPTHLLPPLFHRHSILTFYQGGRAYPDLAAQGQSFAFVWNNTFGTISGTSAATPLTAGIIALVNDALIDAGHSPLGFLNPWLYRKGHRGLTDILSGTAVGCGVDGFPALKGWDAVTGFGTPVFPELMALALSGHESHEDN